MIGWLSVRKKLAPPTMRRRPLLARITSNTGCSRHADWHLAAIGEGQSIIEREHSDTWAPRLH